MVESSIQLRNSKLAIMSFKFRTSKEELFRVGNTNTIIQYCNCKVQSKSNNARCPEVISSKTSLDGWMLPTGRLVSHNNNNNAIAIALACRLPGSALPPLLRAIILFSVLLSQLRPSQRPLLSKLAAEDQRELCRKRKEENRLATRSWMTKGRRREGKGDMHAIGERGGGQSNYARGWSYWGRERERMSVVVEEAENRNSFAGTGETTRREGICMRDVEKEERRWSAMNGRITHRRGDLEGEGNEAACCWCCCCCPMANRSTLPRCLESATVQGTPWQNGKQRSHCQWKKLKGRSTSCAAQRREEWTA